MLVSLGHAEATYEEARAGIAAGARAFTHLFNAMSPLTGRAPGMVGAALADSESFVGVIADGFHAHPASVAVAFAAKRHDRFMLITDAMPPAAGGPDRFRMQDRWILTADGRLTLEDGTLAGSSLTMDVAVRNAVRFGVPLADALDHVVARARRILAARRRPRPPRAGLSGQPRPSRRRTERARDVGGGGGTVAEAPTCMRWDTKV